MRKRVQVSLTLALLATIFTACQRPLLGIVTETYVNQSDTRQTLELTTKETLKGFIAGRSPNPSGMYTRFDDQGVTTGDFTKKDNAYILKSEDKPEFRIALDQDGSLRDDTGNIWRLQERSRSFRPPDEVVAERRVSRAN